MSCDACCDHNIQIYGDDLYQWDVDRQIIIVDDPTITQVHFSHCKEDGRAMVVETIEDDFGNLFAYIPNSLLTVAKDIYVWTWKDEHTISGAYKLKVYPRSRPDNYIYKPSDVITLETVVEWVKKTIEETVNVSTNYDSLANKPCIEGVELSGDKTMEDFGVIPLSTEEIDKLFE